MKTTTFFRLCSHRPLVVALAVCAGVGSHGCRARGPSIPHTRYELHNGLTVIFHEDRRLPLVAVNLWYYVGSKDEPPGRSGFAHLFEHLMFMGTEEVPQGEFDNRIEGKGGSNNASTTTDRTNYFEWGPKELLDTFLFLEADRMAGLGAAISQEKLDTQRDVVRDERRQRFENQPYGKVGLEIPKKIYPLGHPYQHTVIGSHEDLQNATLDDVKEFFSAYYFPHNASLVIAGDFDRRGARRLVEEYFGPLRIRAPLERPEPPEPKIEGTLRITLTDAVELPLLGFVWHSPAFFKPGDAEMDILGEILGGGKSSRLYRTLVYEKKLAQNVRVFQASRFLGSEFRILVFGRPGVSLDEIEAEVDRELERLRSQGPSQREVDRARNGIESLFWRGVESVRDRADLLNRYQFYFGDPGSIARDRMRYDDVTPASVTAWANRILKPDARLIVRVLPKRESPSSGEGGEPVKAATQGEEE